MPHVNVKFEDANEPEDLTALGEIIGRLQRNPDCTWTATVRMMDFDTYMTQESLISLRYTNSLVGSNRMTGTWRSMSGSYSRSGNRILGVSQDHNPFDHFGKYWFKVTGPSFIHCVENLRNFTFLEGRLTEEERKLLSSEIDDTVNYYTIWSTNEK